MVGILLVTALASQQAFFLEVRSDVVAVQRELFGHENIAIANVIAAQAVLESGVGESLLSKKYYNLFGITAGKWYNGRAVWLRERATGKLVRFRVYASRRDCIKDYFMILMKSKYYQDAYQAMLRGDIDGFISGLLPVIVEGMVEKPGWSTDPLYREKWYNVIRRYRHVWSVD
jgi:flagellum-specific peptidoglycan hydrolase FlgJ